MGNFDQIIFKNKKFSDILEEIYSNQKKTKDQVLHLIGELKPLIQEIGDATLIVPLIKEYMELSIKNDEHLLKMATIIQRVVQNNSSSSSSGDFLISDEEKNALMEEYQKVIKEEKKNNK